MSIYPNFPPLTRLRRLLRRIRSTAVRETSRTRGTKCPHYELCGATRLLAMKLWPAVPQATATAASSLSLPGLKHMLLRNSRCPNMQAPRVKVPWRDFCILIASTFLGVTR